MKRLILSLFIVCALVMVAGRRAEAFIGGDGSSTGSNFPMLGGGGFCSGGFGPCNPGACPPGETCLVGDFTSATSTQDGTSGEASAVQSAFYECDVKSSGPPVVKSNEDTLLVLKNEHPGTTLCACVLLFDGNSTGLFSGLTELPGDDVDEIDLCSLVPPPPPGGLTGDVKVVTALGTCPANLFTTFQGGAYAWIKDVVFKGTRKSPPDPFSANVLSVAKTELRVTPGGVDNGSAWTAVCSGSGPVPPASYLANTAP